MNILTAPFFALFSVSFYRRVIHSELWKGFQYLFYLSGVTVIVFMFIFATVGFPKIKEFLDWVKTEMPVITFTQSGISVNVKTPYTMVHPQLGSIATFDMTKTDATTEDLKDVFVFVTSKNVYVRQSQGQVRTYDIAQAAAQRGAETAVLNAESIQKLFDTVKVWLLLITGILIFIFFMIWKILAALFYSWIGLLINLMRHSKLTFSEVYNVSIFAMTAPLVIQWCRLLVPGMDRLPFGFLGSVMLTVAYLFIGIKLTEEKPAA